MTYPRVQPGQPLRIKAQMHNDLIVLLGRQRVQGVGSSLASRSPDYYTRVIARNTDDTYMPARGVGRATDSMIDPAENLSKFLGRPVFAVEPASESNEDAPIVIAENRIEAGGDGRVAVGGIIQTRINVTDTDHRFAKPSTSTAWQLDSDADEGLPILYKESGTGEVWGIVALEEAQRTTAQEAFIRAEITGATQASPNRFKYEWQEVEPDPASPGGYTAVSGGRNSDDDGFAYNMTEANNTATGPQGSGVDYDNLPTGYDFVPVGDAPVKLYGPFGSDPAWWEFEVSQHVDGEACT